MRIFIDRLFCFIGVTMVTLMILVTCMSFFGNDNVNVALSALGTVSVMSFIESILFPKEKK